MPTKAESKKTRILGEGRIAHAIKTEWNRILEYDMREKNKYKDTVDNNIRLCDGIATPWQAEPYIIGTD